MLAELSRQTIFERRRKARRDLWLLLAALLGGQLFFFGLMAWASQFLLVRPIAADLGLAAIPFFKIGLGVGLIAWCYQAWIAFKAGGKRFEIFLEPDPDDERHQEFRRQASDVALAAGLRGLQARVAATPAMNSFCWQDAQGGNFVGITEGLLSRLNPGEMQAVAARHATHLAYDDVRLLEIAGSSVSIFDEICGERNSGGLARLPGRDQWAGPAIALMALAALAYWVMRLLFAALARGRILHADAGAVAMTRDPLSLASALEKASRGGGAGLWLPPSLAPLLLVPPSGPELGSHPPLEKRLRLLLRDAGASFRQFMQQPRGKKDKAAKAPRKARPTRFWLNQSGAWQGPFPLGQLMRQPGMDGLCWVSEDGSGIVERAGAMPDLAGAFKRPGGAGACPRCKVALKSVRYEGAALRRCPHCDGHFLSRAVLRRLIARREEPFSLSDHKRALAIRKRDWGKGPEHAVEACGFGPMNCPACGKPAKKRVFDHIARVPVDQCENPICEGLWLDGGELELIQILHERPEMGMTPKGRLAGRK